MSELDESIKVLEELREQCLNQAGWHRINGKLELIENQDPETHNRLMSQSNAVGYAIRVLRRIKSDRSDADRNTTALRSQP